MKDISVSLEYVVQIFETFICKQYDTSFSEVELSTVVSVRGNVQAVKVFK